jgi:hypothetical protein
MTYCGPTEAAAQQADVPAALERTSASLEGRALLGQISALLEGQHLSNGSPSHSRVSTPRVSLRLAQGSLPSTQVRTMCGSRTGGWSLPCVMSD